MELVCECGALVLELVASRKEETQHLSLWHVRAQQEEGDLEARE